MGQEKKPERQADKAIDDVFITPRVIDRRAIEEYSATLQDLIREAAGRGESLATAATDVRALGENLREVTKELKTRLEVAVKIMPTLEHRLGKADQILQLATDRVKLSDHLDKSIESLIEDRVAQAEKHAASIIDAATQRAARLQIQSQARVDDLFEAAATRLEAITQSKLKQVLDHIGDAHRGVMERAASANATLGPRLAALDSAVHELDRRIASRSSTAEKALEESLAALQSQLADRRREIDDWSGASAARRAAWNDDLTAAEGRAREIARLLNESAESSVRNACEGVAERLHSELHARLHAEAQAKLSEFEGIAGALARTVCERSDATARELQARLHDGLRQMEEITARAADRAQPGTETPAVEPASAAESLRSLVERAEQLADPSGGASLSSAVMRGEELRGSALSAANQFENIRQQADLARVMLGDWINTAVARIDRENERLAALQNAVEASGTRIEAARHAQENLARTLSQTIDLAQQATKMLSSTSPSITSAPAPGAPVQGQPPHTRGDLPTSARDSIERVREEFLR